MTGCTNFQFSISFPRRVSGSGCACLLLLPALLLWPGSILGSPAGALREYKSGQYEQALKEYQRLLQRKGDDPRLRYNAGAAAYRNRQFDEAAKQLEEALNASDPRLLERAYYNRGNTLYYLGEQAPDPSKRTETWQKSLQDFQNTLKLNPQDQDAKFNLEFVKKKLEELKQQQQQSQQNKSDQQQNQDQQQRQQQDQSQKQNKDQQQQQQAQEQKPDQSQQQQAQQPKQDDQKKQQAAQSDEQKKEQQAKQSSAQPKESDQKPPQEAATPAGQMTPEQAAQLLDSQKGEEMMLPANPKGKPADRARPRKDW